MRNLEPSQRDRAMREVIYAAVVTDRDDTPVVIEMRAGGTAIAGATRDELLAKAVAREYVELEIDLVAYEQVAGERNRKGFRIRDGAMTALGRSGKGTPFLRDHNWDDVAARGGVVLKSETRKTGEGAYQIVQTVRLTAPEAVERALRGLMSSISMGAIPTGPVMCSACDAPIFTACWHCPFDVVAGADGESDHVVEWIYMSAELVESSEVSVPAVPRARIESVRAALLASATTFAAPGGQPHQGVTVNLIAKLAPILMLAATAGEHEVLAAVEAQKLELETKRTELAIADKENAELTAKVAVFEAEASKRAEDDFVASALKSGRIAMGDVDVWRDLFQANATRAKERGAKRAPGQSTPVGQPRQSDESRAVADGAANDETGVQAAFETAGVDYGNTLKFAAAFGARDPKKALAKHVVGGEA